MELLPFEPSSEVCSGEFKQDLSGLGGAKHVMNSSQVFSQPCPPPPPARLESSKVTRWVSHFFGQGDALPFESWEAVRQQSDWRIIPSCQG